MSSLQVKASSIRIPEELKSRLLQVCEYKKMTQTDGMLEAIQSWVEVSEKRIQLYAEARRAHEHYLMTGLHVTNDEVAAWGEKLRQGEKAEPPKCHR